MMTLSSHLRTVTTAAEGGERRRRRTINDMETCEFSPVLMMPPASEQPDEYLVDIFHLRIIVPGAAAAAAIELGRPASTVLTGLS